MAKQPQPRIQVPKSTPNASKLLGIILLVLVVGLILVNFLPTLNIGGCVGLIEVNGVISTTPTFGSLSSSELVGLIEQADERPDIRSILVIINSPGGSVVASRAIHSAMISVTKPIYAYISDVGASGGYFVAVGADKIYADKGSITGSVGARATFIEFSTLLDNLGINATTVKSGEMKDIGDIYRPMTEAERELIQAAIDEVFADFKQTVHESRVGKNSKYSIASLEKISDARIITGKQAYDLGLIDELGTMKDAIKATGAIAGMSDPSLCKLTIEKDVLSSLVSTMGRGIGEAVVSGLTTDNLKIIS